MNESCTHGFWSGEPDAGLCRIYGYLSGKSGRIARAFENVESDVILLAGDLVNDGYTEQFALLKGCVEEKIPHKKLLSVTGNHDQLFSIVPNNMEDYKGYSVFQQYLLR